MRSFSILLVALSIWSAVFGAESLAMRHVGIWAFEDNDVYVGVSLHEGGMCKVIVVDKNDVGFSFNCKYAETRGDIVTTEASDSSGNVQSINVHLAYDASADVVQFLNDRGAVAFRLARVPKLSSEAELRWHK